MGVAARTRPAPLVKPSGRGSWCLIPDPSSFGDGLVTLAEHPTKKALALYHIRRARGLLGRSSRRFRAPDMRVNPLILATGGLTIQDYKSLLRLWSYVYNVVALWAQKDLAHHRPFGPRGSMVSGRHL